MKIKTVCIDLKKKKLCWFLQKSFPYLLSISYTPVLRYECNLISKELLKYKCSRWVKVQFRYLFYCTFRQDQNAAETVRDIYFMNGNHTITKKNGLLSLKRVSTN